MPNVARTPKRASAKGALTEKAESRRPVARRTQTERSEETRERLLDAAVELLKRDGYGGFRVNHVATLAGVSRGAQTHHFPTKEALLEQAVEHILKKVGDRARGHTLHVHEGEDLIQALMRDSIDCYLSEGLMITLDFAADGKHSKFSDRVASLARRYRLEAEEVWIQTLMASGRSRQEAEDILWLSFNLVRGLAVRTSWEHDHERISHLLNLWPNIILSHFGPSKKPATD